MHSLRAHWLLLPLLLLCASAHAQTTCPWLTQGTASTWLQGPVTVSTNLLSTNEGTCTFTLHQDNASYTLEITVSATDHPRCPTSSKPIAGIGNQAVLCSASPSRNQTTDTINSRIRDRYSHGATDRHRQEHKPHASGPAPGRRTTGGRRSSWQPLLIFVTELPKILSTLQRQSQPCCPGAQPCAAAD